MVHLRGHRSSYDAWEKGGATGWNYDTLRVADASVMPAVVSANINATVLAIAERAASLISE
jgi:choline dehydrogenase-like flavoprotein